jgi:signal transduction histidine kinase
LNQHNPELPSDVPITKIVDYGAGFELSIEPYNHQFPEIQETVCRALDLETTKMWVASQLRENSHPVHLVRLSDSRYILLQYLHGESNEHYLTHHDLSGDVAACIETAMNDDADYLLVVNPSFDGLAGMGFGHSYHEGNQDDKAFIAITTPILQGIEVAILNGDDGVRFYDDIAISMSDEGNFDLRVNIDVLKASSGHIAGYIISANFKDLNQLRERLPFGTKFMTVLQQIPTPVIAYRYNGEEDDQPLKLFVLNNALRRIMRIDTDISSPDIPIGINDMLQHLDPASRDELIPQIQRRLTLLRTGPTVLEPIKLPFVIDGERIVLINFPMSILDANGELFILNFFLDNTHEEWIAGLTRVVSESMSIIAHDLRTPLTNMKTYIFLLENRLRSLGIDDEKVLTYIQLFTVFIQAMNETVNAGQVIANARGTKELISKRFSLDRLLDEISLQFDTHKIVHHYDLIDVSTNEEALRLAIENLIHNAVHYTPDGGTVTIDVAQLDSLVTIAITDTGIGVHPDYLDRIFDKSYRDPTAKSIRPEGTGLGLHFVKSLAELLEGNTWVESNRTVDMGPNDHPGSTFYFQFRTK